MSLSLSWRAVISVSVELFVLHFCLFEELETVPAPKATKLPVCPRQSSCIWWDPSMYQWIAKFIVSALKTNLRYRAPLRYFKTLLSFPQSSSSGACTHVVKNVLFEYLDELCSVCCKQQLIYCMVECIRLFFAQFLPSSLTLKRWSAAGVADTPVISSRKSDIMFDRYLHMLICTSPSNA